MSETKTKKETLDQATVDPPDNNGGTTTSASLSLNSTEPVDPPDNNGGTGSKKVAP
jgi:hypothetical protein